jgi:hypothetical protein
MVKTMKQKPLEEDETLTEVQFDASKVSLLQVDILNLITSVGASNTRVEVALALVLAAEAYLRADGCSRPWHALHSGIECLEQLLEEMPPGDVEIISVPFDENGPN